MGGPKMVACMMTVWARTVRRPAAESQCAGGAQLLLTLPGGQQWRARRIVRVYHCIDRVLDLAEPLDSCGRRGASAAVRQCQCAAAVSQSAGTFAHSGPQLLRRYGTARERPMDDSATSR